MLYPQEITQKSLQLMLVSPSASGYQITTLFSPTFGESAVNIS